MKNIITKFFRSISDDGAARTIRRVVNYPRRRYDIKKGMSGSLEQRFAKIYRRNHWGSLESKSGAGSELRYTKTIRVELPKMMEQLQLNSMLDAPCGDFNWMRHILDQMEIQYIGGDIVQDIIAPLTSEFSDNDKVNFKVVDITRDKLPTSDLWFCRDCWFHLSFSDIRESLRNFMESNTPYILTTTHLHESKFQNSDIESGGFRLIDLFGAPFNFPTDSVFDIIDWAEPHHPKKMCLWTREQASIALKSLEEADS